MIHFLVICATFQLKSLYSFHKTENVNHAQQLLNVNCWKCLIHDTFEIIFNLKLNFECIFL